MDEHLFDSPEEARPQQPISEIPVSSSPEREKKEGGQPADEKERQEYAAAYTAAMRKRRIENQNGVIAARERLLQMPSAPVPSAFPRSVERRAEPMPRVDKNQILNIEGFGQAMILFVDEESGTMFFTTPEERRRIDIAQSKDESLSSREAANFSDVIPFTADQVRQLLQKQPERRMAEPERLTPERPVPERPLSGIPPSVPPGRRPVPRLQSQIENRYAP
ncbi:MAG: hypothetical protein WCT28_04475 [Patescibacteria group bacterium]|jgi:hypothetical protein